MKATPLLDVVMLVHDTWEWADLAVRAVENHTKNPYRLIIVDMASAETKTKEGLRDAEGRGHTVVRLSENKSFSAGVNAGVAAGIAPNIVVLNDDAIVTDAWDAHFLADLSDKTVGMVGARVIGSALGAMGDPTAVGEPPFLVFVCVALRREVWTRLGPMDSETFDGFSSEDLDYSWWVKKNGYRLKVSNAVVLHAGSRTLAKKGVDVSAETRARYEQKYNTRLLQKWERQGGPDWVAEHSRHKLKVLLAAYSATEWLRADFATAIIELKAGTYPFVYLNQRRTAIQMARTLVADFAVNNGFDVIVQLDDDATFPPDLLTRLIGHDKEVVSALAYQRGPPYPTVAYDLTPDCFDKDGNISIDDKAGLMLHHLDNLEGQGLRQVDITGFHCSAIRTSVFKKLRKAGIKAYYGGYENKLGEDYAFCCNLRKVGIPIHLDCNLVAGHIGDAKIVDANYKAAFKAGRAL